MQAQTVLIGYFLFIVAIGILSAFRIKKADDYYVAGKKAGAIQITGSLLATILGGSAILGTIELSQAKGWPAVWFLGSGAIGLLALIPLSKSVARYGHYTFPELLATFYGNKAEKVAAVIIPIAWVGIVAAQIIAAAKILSGLGFISYQNAAILSALVFIGYTLLGGQLSILKTDALQSLLIVAGLTALLLFSFSTPALTPVPPFEAGKLFNESFTLPDLLVLLLTYSITFTVGPDIYSRVFCAKSEKTAARSILATAVILIPIAFALTYLGLYSRNHSDGLIAFAGHLLPGWAYGLFIAALLSAVMSSADTTLLTASIILNELFTGNLNRPDSMRISRWFIIILGLLSLILALFVTSIIQVLLLSLSFFSGAFAVPILMGLLGIKTNKQNILPAIIAGGLLALTGKCMLTFGGYTYLGNTLVIVSFMLNFLILKLPFKPQQSAE